MKKWTWAFAVAAVVLLVLALAREHEFFRSPRSTSDARPASQSAELPEDETSGAQATEAAGGFTFQVLDLADGRPVVGVRFRALDGARVITVDSGRDGMVVFPASEIAQLSLDAPLWSAGPATLNKPRETGIYWIHRRIAIQGVVRVRGDATGFDPKTVTIHVVVDGNGAPEKLPNTESRAELVEFRRPRGSPSADGRFSLTVPRVHGIAVAATARGWKTVRQSIDVSGTTDRVELWLERALRIRGVVRSSDGTPFENLSVTCLSLVKLSATEITSENLRLMKPNGGFTGSVTSTGKARAKFITIATTDKQGRFELSLPIEGEVLIVAFPFGHRPVYLDLGVLGGDDVNGLDVVAEQIVESSWLRVVENGKPVEGEKLFIADLSLKDGDAQPGVYVRLDAESRIPSDWLIPTRRFFFHIGRFSGHLVWDSRDALDVAKDLRSVSELPK